MDKKQELLINAAQIIHEEGIQSFTMDYLAKKSNMTKGGVLYHFESKTTLLVKMNELVIEQFEKRIEQHINQLTGDYIFTRAYGLATADYIKDEQNILLPAVFITSLEEQKCKELWDQTLQKWDNSFQQDKGDPTEILTFRLICDGIWFTITYHFDHQMTERVTKLLYEACKKLSSGE